MMRLFDKVELIGNGLVILGLSILTVNGSRNLDEFTGQILVRLTAPVLAVGTLFLVKDVIDHDYDK